MEKRIWNLPRAVVENFEVNEYIAGCSDTTNEYWDFKCDATGGFIGLVAIDENKNGKFDLFVDTLTAGYHNCGASHYVRKTSDTLPDEFYPGWYATGADGNASLVDEVIVWKGNDNDNVHVSNTVATDIQVVTGNKS